MLIRHIVQGLLIGIASLTIIAGFSHATPSGHGHIHAEGSPALRFVMLRAYLPKNGFENVPLPKITIINKHGREKELKNCPWRDSGETPDFSEVVAQFKVAPEDFDRVAMLRAMAEAAGVRPGRKFPFCSWWFTLQSDTVNLAYPDTNAVYWGTPFFDDGNTRIRLDGEYSDQRYMSLTTYDQNLNFFEYTTPSGHVFSSTITDFEIEPINAGTNPFQNKTRVKNAPFSVTIKSRPRANENNVLPASPNSNGLGDAGDVFPLPCNVTDEFSCSTSAMFSSPPEGDQQGFFGNPANTYIASNVDLRPHILSNQQPGTLYVIRGKLPVTTAGKDAEPWPNPDVDMRYFSMCTGPYIRPYPTTLGDNACVADLDLVLSRRNGKQSEKGKWYTIVISTEEEKPSNITGDPQVDGVNWLKGSAFSPTVLLMRNMLPNPDFRFAAQNVEQTGSYFDAIKTMRRFYPAITVKCNKAHYEKFGWGGCVAPVIQGTNPFDREIEVPPPGLPGVAKR
jgi:hypothetical protein